MPDGRTERRLTRVLWQRLAVNRAIAGQLISLTSPLGRPVDNDEGTKVGRVNDVAIRWLTSNPYPRVTAVLIRAGKRVEVIKAGEVPLARRFRSDDQRVPLHDRAGGTGIAALCNS